MDGLNKIDLNLEKPVTSNDVVRISPANRNSFSRTKVNRRIDFKKLLKSRKMAVVLVIVVVLLTVVCVVVCEVAFGVEQDEISIVIPITELRLHVKNLFIIITLLIQPRIRYKLLYSIQYCIQ